MPKDLSQWLQRLESLDPSKIELGLERTQAVFKRLNPKITAKIVVVAGTNGKGSTVSALQALLMSRGQSVGSYLSPHLQRFNERICFQGVPVADQELVDAFDAVEASRDETPLTYFEFITLAAIQLLAHKQPDYLLFEVGLGGRLDAVNILDADVSIVTGVALDHMDWLGEDIESIGFEKAGVYRSNKPAIYASENCPQSVRQRIADIAATPYIFAENLHVESQIYSIEIEGQTQVLTMPEHHLPPASLLAAISAFVLLGFQLNAGSVSDSELLARVSLPGRYQKTIFAEATCILDVAHNAQAASFLAQRLEADKDINQPFAVVGTMSDKELVDIFQPLVGLIERWLLVEPDIPRAASLKQQRRALNSLGVSDVCIQDIGPVHLVAEHLQGISAAVVFGSFYTVGEFLDMLDQQ